MLNKILKGSIKEFFTTKKEAKIQRERQKHYIENIMSGKTSLDISNPKIAEIIVKWCDDEENPVHFFISCLEKMGLGALIKFGELSEHLRDCYYIPITEIESGDDEDILFLRISRMPKEFLQIGPNKKVEYNIQNKKLIIQELDFKIEYCETERVQIFVGNDILIILTGYDWSIQENLYDSAKKLIKDLRNLKTNLQPYSYYIESKAKIAQYYNLENVQINFSTKTFSITSQDGKLISYKDPAGITINNFGYKGWIYKEYRKKNVRLSWGNNTFKCEGIPNKDIQQYVDIAEKAIEAIENLEF